MTSRCPDDVSMSRCRLDVTRHVSREGVVMSPAATWTVQTDTPPVPSLAAVLGQGVEILVIVHPKWVFRCESSSRNSWPISISSFFVA